MADTLKNITLVGASGNLGSKTLKALLKHDTLNISVITRPSSTIGYPSKITVKQGEYSDKSFMHSALQGQDVVVVLLGFAGLPYQEAIIDAAARAGVEYILPAEYGLDSANNKILDAVEVIQDKRDIQQKIEALGMKWIAVVTGPWIDYVRSYFFSVLLYMTAIDTSSVLAIWSLWHLCSETQSRSIYGRCAVQHQYCPSNCCSYCGVLDPTEGDNRCKVCK